MNTQSSNIVQRLWDHCNMLGDESLEDSASLTEPEVLASEIVDELKAALEQFTGNVEEFPTDTGFTDRASR